MKETRNYSHAGVNSSERKDAGDSNTKEETGMTKRGQSQHGAFISALCYTDHNKGWW